MCWRCSPYCSKCKPAEMFTVRCPSCGKALMVKREAYLNLCKLPHVKSDAEKTVLASGGYESPVCSKCGTDMVDVVKGAVKPRPCLKSRIICGYPCEQRKTKHTDGMDPCPAMVPLGKYREPDLPEGDPLR